MKLLLLEQSQVGRINRSTEDHHLMLARVVKQAPKSLNFIRDKQKNRKLMMDQDSKFSSLGPRVRSWLVLYSLSREGLTK